MTKKSKSADAGKKTVPQGKNQERQEVGKKGQKYKNSESHHEETWPIWKTVSRRNQESCLAQA